MDEFEMKKEIRKAKRWNICIFSFFCTLLLLILGSFAFYRYNHSFTPEKWIDSPNDRGKLVDDMIHQYGIIGMSETEVVDLLGEEDQKGCKQATFKNHRTYYPPDSNMVYFLGVDYVDGVWLVISLDHGVICDYCFGVT